MHKKRRPAWTRLAVLVVAVLVVGSLAAVAVASSQKASSRNKIKGCVSRRTRAVRLLAHPSNSCQAGEVAVVWNKRGRRGPRGLAGVAGATGATGAGAT
nr:hypothetical protein [Actinomycetota bacterium]